MQICLVYMLVSGLRIFPRAHPSSSIFRCILHAQVEHAGCGMAVHAFTISPWALAVLYYPIHFPTTCMMTLGPRVLHGVPIPFPASEGLLSQFCLERGDLSDQIVVIIGELHDLLSLCLQHRLDMIFPRITTRISRSHGLRAGWWLVAGGAGCHLSPASCKFDLERSGVFL
mmetsp:Transcript_12122/g.27666  ORF Transcript_12122/g.27666 Transcript_12122/m.27666 type:complete len:171 (-) Transcript_12122:181-693(-)